MLLKGLSHKEIAALREHPMRRAFRVDKTTLAALDAVFPDWQPVISPPSVPAGNVLDRPIEGNVLEGGTIAAPIDRLYKLLSASSAAEAVIAISEVKELAIHERAHGHGDAQAGGSH